MMPNYRSLDTLKKARNGFNFNSNKLDYIAKFLGVGAKVSHSGFSMWVGVMNGDEEAMKEMVHYCQGDIIVLEDVYQTLAPYIADNTHVGVANGQAKYSCPSCGSEKVELYKNAVTAKGGIVRTMQCACCKKHYDISNSAYRVLMLDTQAWSV